MLLQNTQKSQHIKQIQLQQMKYHAQQMHSHVKNCW